MRQGFLNNFVKLIKGITRLLIKQTNKTKDLVSIILIGPLSFWHLVL